MSSVEREKKNHHHHNRNGKLRLYGVLFICQFTSKQKSHFFQNISIVVKLFANELG